MLSLGLLSLTKDIKVYCYIQLRARKLGSMGPHSHGMDVVEYEILIMGILIISTKQFCLVSSTLLFSARLL